MATKQELETQVAELTAQLTAALAAQAPTVALDPASSQAVIDKIESDLRATLKSEVDALNAELHEAKKALYFVHKDLDDEKAKSADLQAKLDSAPRVQSSEGTSVVLDGVPHEVVQRERMADLVEMWRKKFMFDDDTVLLVKKV